MISSADMVLWVYATVLSAYVAFFIIVRGQFRRFFALTMYFAIMAAVDLLQMHVLNAYGYTSPEYGYFYYFSDLLRCVLLYFVIATLYRKVFPAEKDHLRLRVGSIVIAAGVGIWSLAIVQAASSRLISRWIVEYNQDLYFVSAVAAVILFGVATNKPNVPKPIHQLAFVFAGYYFFFALVWMIGNLSPRWSVPRGGLVAAARCSLCFLRPQYQGITGRSVSAAVICREKSDLQLSCGRPQLLFRLSGSLDPWRTRR
jgi:hypothetical protein